jgi:hypothetical protein
MSRLSNLAFDADGPAVQADQFLNERQTDAGSLVRARARTTHTVKTLEHVRQLIWTDANPAIANRQMNDVVSPRERELNAPLERKLEGVGQQVEHDLFPHRSVDVHRHVQRRTVDIELQSRGFNG